MSRQRGSKPFIKMQEDAHQFEVTGDIRFNPKKAVAGALKLQNMHWRANALVSASSNPRFARRAEDFDSNDIICLHARME